jgi:tetratricopeptide (TPR) repeat protein
MLGAERFGVSAAEDLSREWLGLRPDDPEVIEAAADLLLTHGHGRSDAQRALELLLPAVPRFPFHFGMRLSLSDAYRDVGDSTNSERVLREIVLRHPDNSGVKVQLALARERRGDVREALALLASAAVSDPRDSEIAGARAGILIRASRISDARSLILECLQTFPENVQWRRRAVDLLMDCGDEEAAVGAARTGVDVHPKGAYLWMLLGETLNRAPSHAAPGEIEQCFRRSVDLNAALFEAADWLSIVLVRQRRYPEAREVIDQFVSRMPSPCAAQGRLAWIWRSEGKNADATEDMVSLVKASPWYSWGWLTLIEWLEEDRAWEKAVALLSAIPEEMRTNREFRRRRLSALEAGGRPTEQLDAEWDKFLKDFPEDISLHLIRYDSLSHGKRFSEAKDLLDRVEPLAVENAYLLARRVEIQGRESQKDAAIETLLRVFFMEIEESIWPANHAWELIQDHHWEKEAYQRAVKCMETGQQPTRRAVFLLACHAARTGEHASSRSALPLIESIFPSKPARELKKLLLLVSKLPQVELSSRAIVLARLTNIGHHRIVVRYWTSNREQLRDNVACWAEVGRALIGLGRKPQARALMHDWRQRKGVAMWMITNYVLTFSSLWRSQLNELSFACRDALAGLQHDHCAKYLAHRLAHAAALLGRQDEFLSIWNTYRNYFDERLEEKEYFRTEERHLISTLPRLGEAIGAGHLREYRKQVKRLQRRRYAALITMKLPSLFGWRLSWWRLIWIALALLVALSRFFSNSG